LMKQLNALTIVALVDFLLPFSWQTSVKKKLALNPLVRIP
jgi:hypothetical protein